MRMTGRARRFAAALLMLLVLAVGGYLFVEEQGNFHPITEGEAYRSAQLDRDELIYYLGKYHIRTVLNLRGSNPDASWYRQEIKTSAEQKVAHYDISLSASAAPPKEDIDEMIQIFRTAPRPVLIHCQAGADRSGLAAAIWKVVIDGMPKKEAAGQLSLLYGHMPIGPTTAMDRFFEGWAPPSRGSAQKASH